MVALPNGRERVPCRDEGAVVIATPYVPRLRCWRCKGRRVVIVDHVEYVEVVPCPACSHRDPLRQLSHVEHIEMTVRAA